MAKRRIPILLIALALAGHALAREPIVGLPCDGCEAVFEGLPATLSSRARLAPPDQPGEPLVLSGRVSDAAGAARAGVIVYAYQTDADGIYPRPADAPGAASRRHGALRGWAVSDAQGRYAFDTVRPGSYPRSRIPAHIHLHVIEPGCATYYLDDVVFDDDPLLTAEQRRLHAHGRGGDGVTTPRRVDGRWLVTRDIVLGAAIPGYRDCAAKPAG